ncbi:TRAP transporter substrate-binding protein [Neobacillus mesonae]|uniref:TRAP transporter substrate-binding protein n=1 Tax=Neobacillus mesonae TaxID=1193713 RepID=UPI002040E6F0|nr:TRAP transporter substrate-binding protein DctP [Neobacillus mesonae]MCM3567508.1 TRAP transporter substrate-binding protein DctP [Neobacillus mesonae]
MEGKKSSFLITCIIAILLLFTGCSSSNTKEAGSQSKEGNNGSGEKTYTFKVATVSVPEDPDSVYIYKAFMDKATELTNGRLKFEWYPSQQLGQMADYLTLTADGVADIGMFSASVFPSELSLANKVTALPGLFQNAYEGSMAFNAVSQKSPMIDEFLSHGVRPLLAVTTPTFNFYSKGVEINVPSDLKGHRVRTSAGTLSEIIKMAGGTPVGIPATETYEAYDKGAVDVLHHYAASDVAHGIRELSNWGSRNLGFSAGTTGFIISEKLWKTLPKDIQDALLEAGKYVAANGSKAWDKDTFDREERWIKDGDVPLHDVTKEERAEWQKFFDKFEKQFLAKQDDQFKDVLEQFKEEVAKVRK